VNSVKTEVVEHPCLPIYTTICVSSLEADTVMQVKVLLDPGSEVSFVTRKVVEKLGEE